jgi:hypothetical protein
MATKKATKSKKSTIKKKKVLNPKVPREYGGGTLTRSQYFGKIRSALRNCFRYWPPLQQALKLASRPSQNTENKRLKVEYQCASCKNWFARKNVEIDHKIPCGTLTEYEHIPDFIKKLAAENVEDYDVLCKPCHLSKTLTERYENKNDKTV